MLLNWVQTVKNLSNGFVIRDDCRIAFAVFNISIPQTMDNAIDIVSKHHFFVRLDVKGYNVQQVNQFFISVKIPVTESKVVSNFLFCCANIFFYIGNFSKSHFFYLPVLYVFGFLFVSI
jgi:hypothetical protein